MIRNPWYFKKFEEEWISKQAVNYEKSVKILEAMWEEGVALGVLPPRDPLEGIEIDIKIAGIINSCLKN